MVDNIGYMICQTQGEIYQYSSKIYHMERFSEVYMKSDFCKRAMDAEYSRFQLSDAEECMDFIVPENKELANFELHGMDFIQSMTEPDVAYWIGFMYRYLALSTGISSEKLADLFPFIKMAAMYPGFHTIDEEQAVEIMMEGVQTVSVQ